MMIYHHGRCLTTSLCAMLLASVSLPFGGAAANAQQTASHAFQIPAADAATALQTFARQSGRQVLFPYNAVLGRRTPAIRGLLPDKLVLAQLAAATRLTVSSDDGRTVTLQAAGAPSAQHIVTSAQAAAGPIQTEAPQATEVAAAAAPAPTQLGEVVVTAARSTQNLQKVSTSVTVISGQSISAQGLTNLGQIFSDTPSIQATGQPGGFSVDVRGLGGDLPAGKTQGSVALVSDGVYNINSQSTTVGFFDVDRIEVLEGPQSTRFGPDADGGIVNVITNDPLIGVYSGHASLTGGNYTLVRGEAAFNVPINDQLALRLSAAAVNRSSYFTPAEGDNKDQSFRAKLLYLPTPDLTVKFTYQLDHIGGTGNGSNVFPVYVNKVPVYSGDSINQLANPWGQAPANPVNENSANLFQQTAILNLTYNVGQFAVLDALGSYSTITGHEIETLYLPPWSTGTPGYGPSVTGAYAKEFAPFDQYTGEVRLHNVSSSSVKWDVGFYHWNYIEQNSLGNASFLSTPPVKTTTATEAVYGEITYPITDRLRLIGGARESFDHRTFNFNNSGAVTPSFGIDFTHFDYRAGAEFDVTPRSMLYFTASSGYRPGGYSAFNPVTDKPSSFASEVNRSYEFGSKNRFLDNRLQVNADIFYYDQSNYQNLDSYTGFIPSTGGAACASGDTRAACQTPTFGLAAHTLGVETQMRAIVTRDDILTFSGTYLRAVFADHQNGCATVAAPTGSCYDGYNSESPYDPGAPFFFNLAGAVQPHSPKYAFTISYQHIFHLPNAATLSAGGDAFHTTGYWVNPVEDATRYGFQPQYWLGNVSVTYTPARGPYTLTGWVRNVSNYAVKQSVLPATSIGDPMTFGGTVAVKW